MLKQSGASWGDLLCSALQHSQVWVSYWAPGPSFGTVVYAEVKKPSGTEEWPGEGRRGKDMGI